MAHPKGHTYVGCRVRWRGGTIWLPPAVERPDAVLDAEVIQVSADVVEYGDGVKVVDGDEGRVVQFAGVTSDGHCYRVVFDNGGEIPLILPQPHVVEFVDRFELGGSLSDEPAPAKAARNGRTYAEYTPTLLARVRAFLRWVAPSGNP